jgi:predicted PurR-regulated permease PerM
MLGIDSRALRVVWTIFLFALLLVVVYYIRHTLITFAVAIFFAYMLSPIVDLVEKVMPKRRNLALTIVYILFVGSLITVGIQIGSTIAEQATALASRLPSLVNKATLSNLPLSAIPSPLREKIIVALSREAANLESSVVPFIQQATGRIVSGVGSALPFFLVPILGFFLLKDARQIRAAFLGSVDDGHDRGTLEEILDDIHILLSKYIRALVLLAIASFAAWAVFLAVLGYPYQLLLAGLAGLLEFIPVIGPFTSGALIVVVCLVTGSGGVLWIIVFWICFRIFQDYVLNPYLMSAGTEIHPLLVLFGVLAGERIGGIPGMFFSVPVLAILKVVYFKLKSANNRKTLKPT